MRVLTGGASVKTNEALLVNNARVAADLAVALASQA
jgi:pseudouridine-5'-phosphate glycosidase